MVAALPRAATMRRPLLRARVPVPAGKKMGARLRDLAWGKAVKTQLEHDSPTLLLNSALATAGLAQRTSDSLRSESETHHASQKAR